MSRNKTAGLPQQNEARVTSAEWFAGGQRIWYDPESARVPTAEEAAAAPGALWVFERVAAAGDGAGAVWLTLLPGFPDGSYCWAQVDRMLGDGLGPRLYVEPVGQGDSDKPRDYPYSTVERADLVEALWRHHGVRRTVVVTFDYTSLALLELLRRQTERTTSGRERGQRSHRLVTARDVARRVGRQRPRASVPQRLLAPAAPPAPPVDRGIHQDPPHVRLGAALPPTASARAATPAQVPPAAGPRRLPD